MTFGNIKLFRTAFNRELFLISLEFSSVWFKSFPFFTPYVRLETSAPRQFSGKLCFASVCFSQRGPSSYLLPQSQVGVHLFQLLLNMPLEKFKSK